MNDYLTSTNGNISSFAYYWEQFHPILSAIAILLIGWVIALFIAAGIKKLLKQCNTNEKLSQATGHFSNIENIIAKTIFWIILVIAVIGALNVLNLTSISGPFSNMIQQFLLFVPKLIAAIAVAFVGWILANLIKVGIKKLLDRTTLDEKLSAEVGVTTVSQSIGDIIYWLVLLLFLPIVLSILGLNGLLFPVQNMVNEVISYLPNIFIAGVIIFVGYILAKIVRGILEGLMNSLKIQECTEKLGVFKNSNISKLIGSFVFAIILITSFIIAFEALGIQAISQPATAMLQEIMNAVPHIIAATLILIIAYVIAKFVAKLVTDLVAGTGIDALPEKIGIQRFLGESKVSNVLGHLIIFFTMLFAISEAANRLGLTQISELIAIFIQFGANILLGAVILLVGFWFANIVSNTILRGENAHSRWLGNPVLLLHTV